MSDAVWLPGWAANYFQDAANIEPEAPADFSIRDDPDVTALFQIAAAIEIGAASPLDAEELRMISKRLRAISRSLDELVADLMEDAPPPVYVAPPRAALTLIQGDRQ